MCIELVVIGNRGCRYGVASCAWFATGGLLAFECLHPTCSNVVCA